MQQASFDNMIPCNQYLACCALIHVCITDKNSHYFVVVHNSVTVKHLYLILCYHVKQIYWCAMYRCDIYIE